MNGKMTSINKYILVLPAVEIKVAAVVKKEFHFEKKYKNYLLIFCIISFCVSG